jgi:alanine racemase
MDLIMVDVGLDISVSTGDEVVLMGRQGNSEIPIYDLCEKLDTIPYEVTCMLSARVPKIHRSDEF